MNIEIRPLTKELKESYLFLFDNMVHKENPEWSKCYCNDYHFLGDVETCTRAMSRLMIVERIDKEELQGYLVFSKGKAVGWCNVNDRDKYQRLLRDFNLVDDPNDKVCSIVCFLIHPDYRRQGLSQRIIEKVIADYSLTDYDYIESYPRKGDSSSNNFKGPIEIYKRNGFMMHKEYEGYYVMRRNLK